MGRRSTTARDPAAATGSRSESTAISCRWRRRFEYVDDRPDVSGENQQTPEAAIAEIHGWITSRKRPEVHWNIDTAGPCRSDLGCGTLPQRCTRIPISPRPNPRRATASRSSPSPTSRAAWARPPRRSTCLPLRGERSGHAVVGLGSARRRNLHPERRPARTRFPEARWLGKRQLPGADLSTGYAGFDLLPADFSYRNFDVHLADRKRPTERLLKMSRSLRGVYSALFLDCAPGISLLSENVLRAADAIIVPLLPTPLSIRMLAQLRDFIAGRQAGPTSCSCRSSPWSIVARRCTARSWRLPARSFRRCWPPRCRTGARSSA